MLVPGNQTDSSVSFNLDSEDCDLCDSKEKHKNDLCHLGNGESGVSDVTKGGRNCYDGRVFTGHGEGRKARNNAFQQCIKFQAPDVARFDCSGGMVAENYWETVAPVTIPINNGSTPTTTTV